MECWLDGRLSVENAPTCVKCEFAGCSRASDLHALDGTCLLQNPDEPSRCFVTKVEDNGQLLVLVCDAEKVGLKYPVWRHGPGLY